MNKISGIYEIVNKVNNHRYIGSSINYIERRRKHLLDLRKNLHHSPYLQRAWNIYGEEAFEFVLMVCVPPQSIRQLEQIFIDEENPEYNVFPLAVGGSVVGHKVTQETKDKIRRANLGNKNSLGYKNGLGYRHTEDARHRIQIGMRGKQNSLDHKQTNKHKQRISNALMGHKGYWTGKSLSKEHKERIGKAFRGCTLIEEHKQKISEAKRMFTREEESMIACVMEYRTQTLRKISEIYGVSYPLIQKIRHNHKDITRRLNG